MLTFIKNARILAPTASEDGLVAVCDGRIVGIHEHAEIPEDAIVIDAKGLYLSPGFIDIHVHGGGGRGVMEGSTEAVLAMCAAHAKHGTTTILPTTLAAPIPMILRSIEAVRSAQAIAMDFNIAGIHLEGPYLAPNQRGAQSIEYLLIPNAHTVQLLLDAWDGIRMMGVAPELPGALLLGDELARRGIVGSIAHSDATFEEVQASLAHGFSDVTHLYSGCSTIIRKNSYRVPGVVEAGLLFDELTVQVIGDLKHLPVPLIKLIYRMKGAENIILITDGLEYSASHLEEGTTYLQPNGVETLYEDGVMKLLDRQSFAGSVATMSRLVKNMWHHADIKLTEAVRMATENPARRIGLSNCKGRIHAGYDADLVLFDEDVNVQLCMVGGRVVSNSIS